MFCLTFAFRLQWKGQFEADRNPKGLGMPLSVTCQCGARLDIDEKFLGKEILCPDCQRPLPTKATVAPPPLDLPSHKRVSALAVLSLAVGLVGIFTIVGSIASIVMGALALRQIKQQPHKLEGAGLARGGIIVSAVGIFLTLALAIYSPLNLDMFLRLLVYTPRTQLVSGDRIKSGVQFGANASIAKPSNDWRLYITPVNPNVNTPTDDLIAINIIEDAFIACQLTTLDLPNQGEDKEKKNIEDREKKAIERFCKSELVNLLGKLNGIGLSPEPVAFDRKEINGDKEQEFYLDVRLGNQARRFLIRWKTRDADTRLQVMVGAARRARFDRHEKEFRDAFESIKFD
jgi:hypothetical protein